MKKHKPCFCDDCRASWYNEPCGGCPEGHPSFWATVRESPQWADWTEEVSKRIHRQQKKTVMKGVWDVDESQEMGWISQGHFQDFLKFCKKK